MNKRHRLLALALPSLLLSACALPPKPLQGEFPAADPRAGMALMNQSVRWGGEILEVEPLAEVTCFVVLAQTLDIRARPRRSDHPLGRFLACKSGFQDPALFAPGREITVTGRVDGQEQRQIGDFGYLMPRVAVDTLFLWQVQPDYVGVYHPPPGILLHRPLFWDSYYYPPRPRPRSRPQPQQ